MPKKGRKGAEQRVKGNVKSASSGRMTELLGSEAIGFIGFDSVSGGLPSPLLTAAAGGDEIDGVIGRDKMDELIIGSGAKFQVVMKQLGKRDTTTKLKALQSFCNLCSEESAQEVLAVLNIWSLMYNKLSMDNDNRVRALSHKALKTCAVAVKSSLAPHLKSIIGSWVSGMCDPHAPAATAAKLAFDEAFHSKKQNEVMEFGLKAIFQHAEEMILKENPDTFSDPKVVPVDERKQRYERALVMSVHSISYSLRRLSMKFLDRSSDVYRSLLLEKRVWKLARHQNPYIRSSMFTLASAVCEQLSQFATENVKILCSAVLGSLAEDDPVVIGPLWEACLLLITKTENWSEHVNVQKALLPGLWSFLKAGGYGSAKFTYPCMLPLLSVLIDKIFSGDASFARLFLERLESGLHNDRVRTLRFECEVIMKVYNECFLYLVFNLKPLEEEENLIGLLELVNKLLDYSLTTQCPSAQSEVIGGAVVKLLTRLLQSKDKNPSLNQCLSQLQAELTETLISSLEDSTERKPTISRLEGILSNFHSPPKTTKIKGGSVRFLEQPPEKVPPVNPMDDIDTGDVIGDHVTQSSNEVASDAQEVLKIRREFIKPAVCLVCAKCIAVVNERPQEEYSRLLVTLVHLYCVDSSFSASLYSSLKSSYPELISDHLGDTPPPDMLALPMLLSKLARLDTLSEKSSKFCSDLVDCVVFVVLHCQTGDDVSAESVWRVLIELSQSHVAVLPLVLLKLGECRRKEKVELLLSSCEHSLTGLLTDPHNEKQIYLWRFLDVLFSAEPESIFLGIEVADTMFSLVCQQLCDDLPRPSREREENSVGHMLKVVGKVQRSLVQNQTELCMKLLKCLLKWSLFDLDTAADIELDMLNDVVQCYSHLVSSLPDPLKYLQTCSGLVKVDMGTNTEGWSHDQLIFRHLQSALVYSTLHSSVLSHDTVYQDLYAYLIQLPKRIENLLLPLSSLDSYCQGELLFSPLPKNLDASAIVDTLPTTLLSLIYPAILLCDQETLVSKSLSPKAKSNRKDHSELEHRLSVIVTNLGSKATNLDSLFFRSGKSVVVDETDRSVDEERACKEWIDTVMSLSLAACCLGESQLKRNDSKDTRLADIFRSAIDRCLQFGGKHSHHWLGKLVEQVAESAAMKGPVWISILHNLFAAMKRLSDVDLSSFWQELTSALYMEPEGPILYSALKSAESDLYKDHIVQFATERQNDPCLLMGCLQLLPDNPHLLSLCSNVLCSISDKQSNLELSLFENLSETEQDSLSYSTLSLISLLFNQQRVPPQVWDFILCSMVSVVQLITDADISSSVNRSVFVCHVFQILHQISLHFNSPLAKLDQSREWTEFFQPALQNQLLPYFINQSDHRSLNPCTSYQRAYLSKAVSVLCTKPDNVSLEDLMNIVLSESYPQQITAFKLTEKLLESQTIVLSDDPGLTTPAESSVVKLSFLQGLFSKCIERINIDLVFFEDSHDLQEPTESSKLTYQHTTAYLLTWLLIIRAMSRCNPETRGVMTEWLKELSLFNHLLHGLFKFLAESQKKTSEISLQVTLKPTLEQLAHVTYDAVARQLPCMLRQWYLTLDRQTSSLVSWFTTKYVSPGLQKHELQSLSKTQTSHGNMEVRVYSGVSEVSVVYHVDEFSIELFVRLPEAYPLQPPAIREGKRVRVDQAQWRKWLLQLTIFVTNQNGSLMDGLLLWKSNLDKHFSGVEDCMICFSVIHSSNYSLPKMICRTCKKRFHSACLYKWFNTSNKSSCPLCRNIF